MTCVTNQNKPKWRKNNICDIMLPVYLKRNEMEKVKKYIIDNKELMKEWDWEKNKDLDPYKITYGSTKRAWWKCSVCGNEWQSIISNRANLHRGCSVCAKTKMKRNRHNTLLQLKGSLVDFLEVLISDKG